MMTSRTVEFYVSKMKTNIKASLTRNASLFSQLNNSPEAVRTATSLSSLLEEYALPVDMVDNLVIGSISQLMTDYTFGGTGIPPRSIFGRLFSCTSDSYDQVQMARQVQLACDRLLMCLVEHRPIQECINEIKTHLEAGLLANNLHPQDNFPKIVKAIANLTAGMEGWEFSPRAMERLNQMEPTNRLVR